MNAEQVTEDSIELQALEHPGIDVRWIAEEINDGSVSGRIKRPQSAFVSACRRAARDGTHRRGTRDRVEASARRQERPQGGFTSAGRWDPTGSWDSLASKLVMNLVWWRRRAKSPPSACALHAAQVGRLLGINPHEILPSLKAWEQLASYEQKDSWYARAAHGQNAAEVAIRYAGDYAHATENLDLLHESVKVQAHVSAQGFSETMARHEAEQGAAAW